MEPQDIIRFEQIIYAKVQMQGIIERIKAQPVSERVKMARLRSASRALRSRREELHALAAKYENRPEPFAYALDVIIENLQAKLAKL
jgi:hypothetical protein